MNDFKTCNDVQSFTRAYLAQHNLSHSELGEKLGLSRSYIGQMVRLPSDAIPVTFLKAFWKVLSPQEKRILEAVLSETVMRPIL